MESEKRATNNNDIQSVAPKELNSSSIQRFPSVTKKTKMTSGLVCENDLITEHVLSVSIESKWSLKKEGMMQIPLSLQGKCHRSYDINKTRNV